MRPLERRVEPPLERHLERVSQRRVSAPPPTPTLSRQTSVSHVKRRASVESYRQMKKLLHLHVAGQQRQAEQMACRNDTELALLVSGPNIEGTLVADPEGGFASWTGDEHDTLERRTSKHASTSSNPMLIHAIKQGDLAEVRPRSPSEPFGALRSPSEPFGALSEPFRALPIPSDRFRPHSDPFGSLRIPSLTAALLSLS